MSFFKLYEVNQIIRLFINAAHPQNVGTKRPADPALRAQCNCAVCCFLKTMNEVKSLNNGYLISI